MSGKYFIFSIRGPSLFAAILVIAFGFLVNPSKGIPVALPEEVSSSTTTTTTAASTTVKILIPPSSDVEDATEDDDSIIIEAGNGTSSPLPQEPFHPSDCFMDKEKGPCRAIIDMWFFNTKTKECEQFQYSGCGGNGNRFSEKTECESRCGDSGRNKDDVDDSTDDTVVIEGDNGEDNSTSTCSEFDGCGPLKCAVIKDEVTGCNKCACSHNSDDEKPEPEQDEDQSKLPVGSVSGTPSEDDDEKMKKEKPEAICGLPEVRGSCRAMLTRYRYDSKSKKCVLFHFGGCDSNGNNFVSEDKCNEFCKGQ